MKLYIKNMVCNRCKMAVKSVLQDIGLHPTNIQLGEVDIIEDNIDAYQDILAARLQQLGFSLMGDKKSKTIEKIKSIIIDLVQNKNNALDTNLSDYLSKQLTQDYSTLSNLFSSVENTTIEKFFIAQKIEKVKELIMYNELTLNEIAFQLNYSSVAHLSNQFKKVTGLSPSYFKQLKMNKRKEIDDV